MKLIHVKHMLMAGAAFAVTTCAYADFQITFDTAGQDTEWSGATWSPGPLGWAGAGCLQATGTSGGWQGSGTVTLNFSYSSGHQPNMWTIDPNAGHISFDIIVDNTSFNASAVNQWWQIFASGNSNPNGWTQSQIVTPPNNVPGDTNRYVYHVDMTFADLGFVAATASSASYYQLNVWANSDNPNPINFYLDNINVYTAATVQPTNYISQVTGPKGLIMITSSNVFSYDVGQEQFQRQNVRTASSSEAYNFYDNGPVTYSLTITNYPSSANSNFQAQVWIVDGAATENAPDYNEADVCGLSIVNNNDGTATASFNYKVGSPFGYGNYFGSGLLGSVSSASVLGTWSVTLAQDNVTVQTPDGHTLVTNMVAGDSAGFANEPLKVYVDTQSIRVENIGQKAVYSKFQITTNNVAAFSDDFSSGALDTTKWSSGQAEDPTGVYQIPTTAAYAVSWTVPAGGFSLQATPGLTGTWFYPGLPSALVGGKQTTYIPSSFTATNGNSFFRLSNP